VSVGTVAQWRQSSNPVLHTKVILAHVVVFAAGGLSTIANATMGHAERPRSF
jgi:hypothetical protein